MQEQLHVGDGKGLHIAHIGHSQFQSPLSTHKLDLKSLLHVPEITKNLLSVSKFCSDNDVFFEFHSSHCCVKDQNIGTVILEGTLRDGLYVFDKARVSLNSQPIPIGSKSVSCTKPISNCKAFITAKIPKSDVFSLWHNRLGHPSSRIVHSVMSKCNVQFSSHNTSVDICSACCHGKIHKFPYIASETVYLNPFELVVIDLWGPSLVQSRNGFKYYISFVDAFTRYTWIYMLKTKSDAFTIFQNFKAQVELQFSHKIKCIQSDWG